MRELTAEEIQQVSGGEMSNRTAIIIGGTCLLFPIMGAGWLSAITFAGTKEDLCAN